MRAIKLDPVSYRIGVEIDGQQYITFFDLQAQREGSISLSTITDFQTRAILKIFLFDETTQTLLKEIEIDNIPPEKAGIPKIDLRVYYTDKYKFNFSLALNDQSNTETTFDVKSYLKQQQPGSFKASVLLGAVAVVGVGFLLVWLIGQFVSNTLSQVKTVNNKPGETYIDHPTSPVTLTASPVTLTKSSASSSSSPDAQRMMSFSATQIGDKEQASASPPPSSSPSPSPTKQPATDTMTVILTSYPTQGASPAATNYSTSLYKKEVVYFLPGRFELLTAARQTLDAFLPALKEHSRSDIRLEGHCALYETEEERHLLSSQRVKAVYAYLIEKGWKPAPPPKLIGYGGERPITRAEGNQQLNRRVEIIIESNR